MGTPRMTTIHPPFRKVASYAEQGRNLVCLELECGHEVGNYSVRSSGRGRFRGVPTKIRCHACGRKPLDAQP